MFLGIIPFSEVKELGSSIEVKCTPKEGIVVGSFVEVVRKDLRVVGDVIRCQLGCFNFLFSCGGKLHLGFLWILRAAAAASLMVRRTRKKWRVVHKPVRVGEKWQPARPTGRAVLQNFGSVS